MVVNLTLSIRDHRNNLESFFFFFFFKFELFCLNLGVCSLFALFSSSVRSGLFRCLSVSPAFQPLRTLKKLCGEPVL